MTGAFAMDQTQYEAP